MYLCLMKDFNELADIISSRRSTKPISMNGRLIPEEQIQKLLELANWAPTHALTEPWRFIVFEGNAMQKFAHDQAELYKSNTLAENFKEASYEKIRTNCELVSHNILVYMKRGDNPNIPVLEEICAVAAAVENLLLGASSAGIAALWSTGGVTLSSALKDYLQLAPDDLIIGQIYLGYSDIVRECSRRIPLEEKVKWVK